jgi:hypothetical protein
MILDAFLRFDDGTTSITATGVSPDKIDLGIAGNNIGIGEPMGVYVTVTVAADNTTTDETYVVGVSVDDDPAFGSSTELASFSIPAGTAAGTKYFLPIPPNEVASDSRYMALSYTLGGTTPSVSLEAYLQPQSMVQNNVLYPDNITIS